VSDRLQELLRQRALQKEHLDWIDREIAALQGSPQPSPPPDLSPPPPLSEPPRAGESDAEAILDEYRRPTVSIEKSTKTGCFIYFAAALLLTAVFVVAVYFYSRAKRGH
jgi:hypothetical protein